jgi:diacylglycerol kinase (ATP)
MHKQEKFSITARIRRVCQFFRGEHNAWIHLTATIIVIMLAAWLQVTRMEAIALLIVTGLVWVTELLNTAIEKIMDFVSVKKHPEIQFIKDVAAGAVLVTATIALITGCIIFMPSL